MVINVGINDGGPNDLPGNARIGRHVANDVVPTHVLAAVLPSVPGARHAVRPPKTMHRLARCVLHMVPRR